VPDIDKLVTILRESQLADKVVSSRKVGFPLDSEAFGSSWTVDDFDYVTTPGAEDHYIMVGANKTLPVPATGGRIQIDDTGDGVETSLCKDLNDSVPVNSPNQVDVRFRQQQVIDNLQTHHFVGLFAQMPQGNPLTLPVDGVYFIASNAGSANNWTAVCRAFNVESSQLTSVQVDIGVDHVFEIMVVNNVAQFFIDGLLEATITTNIPTANLRMGSGVIGRDATPFGFQMDSYLLWSERQ
jgi:hypothetical protein